MTNTLTLMLDGRHVDFQSGQTILEVARSVGVFIPTLCHLEGVSPSETCRVCVVEVEGADRLLAACATPAEPGMMISTDSFKVQEARRQILEMLIDSGDHNCLTCESSGDCRLQDLAYRYGIKRGDAPFQIIGIPAETDNPFIIRDFSKCLACGRCVKACNEVQVNRVIQMGQRGITRKVITEGDRPLSQSSCVFCGECLQVCPVGALVAKKARGQGRTWETTQTRTTCPYCGVGCQLQLHVRKGKIIKVTGVEEAQPNQGRLCVKGRFGYDFIYSPERLKTPLIREKDGFREASWDEALDLVARKFQEIKAVHGPDAIAGVSCARSISEDSYNMQKLFRAVIGTNNIDHCART